MVRKVVKKLDRMYRIGLGEDVRKHLNIVPDDLIDIYIDEDKDYIIIKKQECPSFNELEE